ncbi:MAG: sensor histidine kinase [Omnitrophica WOR_2 bacterium]
MLVDQKDIPITEEYTYSPPESENQLYFVVFKDNKGRCLSNNLRITHSDKRSVLDNLSLQQIIEETIQKNEREILTLEEFTREIEFKGEVYNFLITALPQVINGEPLIQYIIRSANMLFPILERNNKQLLNERNLNRLNSKCISSVSHDFRTPLSIIYANLQLLEYHEFQLDRETIEDAFSLSRMAVKSLLRVLDKVTLIDSMNKNRLEYKPVKTDLKKLCEAITKELNEAEVIPGRIKFIHDDSIGEVFLDEYLFTSLFTHLIFNALSYSKKNHQVQFESKQIEKNFVRVIVKDDGMGFTQEQISSLSVFFNDSGKNTVEGIGLGLAIVKECLLLQKGNISIVSEPCKGTEFVIDLPVNLNC